ncbi:MAG: RnfABCDGE type electron transport complex subunit G [Eubacteriales bacterium]|nr:RnfABCDGE type electron transport complex subunit G [Eubacteriales bacterium]
MAKKKSNIFTNTLVLVVVTFVAIAALAVVNQITAEPIAKADVNLKAQAFKVVYADVAEFAEIDGVEKMIEESAALLEENGFGGCTVTDALAVKNDAGDTEGYIVVSTSPNGYGGEIQVAIGIKDEKITGFTAIKNNETAGLGSKCTEPEYTDQFAGKAAAVLSYTKSGASSDTEIDAISGATITTNATVEAVNAGIIFYQQNFGGGVQEIEGPDLTEYYQQAYPDAKEFADVEGSDKMIESSAKLLADCGLDTCTVEEIKAVNGGEGYVISTTGIGFAKSAPIQIVIGIKDNKLTGYAVVSHMETPGYGAACEEEPFAGQFAGKDAAVLGADEVDAISGATFTTTGITNAVNAAIVFYQTNLGDGSVEIDKNAIAESANVDAASGATA